MDVVDDRLAEAADEWARTDEIKQLHVDAAQLAEVVQQFTTLARLATAHLYCWWGSLTR